MIRFEQILTPSRSLVNVLALSKDHLLKEIAKLLANEFPSVNSTYILTKLIAREKLGSTFFGNGIAIPHCCLKGTKQTISAILKLYTPIYFDDDVDHNKVDIIFVLIVPEDATEEHLELLGKISIILDRSDVRENLRNANDSQSLYQSIIDTQNN